MQRVVRPSHGAFVSDDVEMLVVHFGITLNVLRAEAPEQPPCFQLHRDQPLVSLEIDGVVGDEQPRPSVHPLRTELPLDLPVDRVDRIQRFLIRAGTERVSGLRG